MDRCPIPQSKNWLLLVGYDFILIALLRDLELPIDSFSSMW